MSTISLFVLTISTIPALACLLPSFLLTKHPEVHDGGRVEAPEAHHEHAPGRRHHEREWGMKRVQCCEVSQGVPTHLMWPFNGSGFVSVF